MIKKKKHTWHKISCLNYFEVYSIINIPSLLFSGSPDLFSPWKTAALDSLNNSGSPCPLLSPWKPSFYFLLLWVWQLYTPCVGGTMQNSCFWDWLLSLNVLKVHPCGAMWHAPSASLLKTICPRMTEFVSGFCILLHRSPSVSMPVPRCFDRCRFVICLRSGCVRPLAVFLSRDYHGYSGSFEIPDGF